MSLRTSYTFIAPFYDLLVKPALNRAREQSLAALPLEHGQRVLLNGVGTGLDLPLLWPMAKELEIHACDINRAMLSKAKVRMQESVNQHSCNHHCFFSEGDAMSLPYQSNSFDIVVLHLILAVTPNPAHTLNEAARVVKEGGHILIMDKFIRPHERAPIRRLFSPLIGRIATRTDVVFEELNHQQHQLTTVFDRPLLAGGWFRSILLQKES